MTRVCAAFGEPGAPVGRALKVRPAEGDGWAAGGEDHTCRERDVAGRVGDEGVYRSGHGEDLGFGDVEVSGEDQEGGSRGGGRAWFRRD